MNWINSIKPLIEEIVVLLQTKSRITLKEKQLLGTEIMIHNFLSREILRGIKA